MRDKIFTMVLLMAITSSMGNGYPTEQDSQDNMQSTQNQEKSICVQDSI